jgi:outer membrane protein assembly factor BamD
MCRVVTVSRLLVAPLVFALLAGCAAPLRQSEPAEKGLRQVVADAAAEADCELARSALARLAQASPPPADLAAARLEVAYACLMARQPAAVLAETEAYLNQHPQDPHRDYARYLRALAEYTVWREQRPAADAADQALLDQAQQARRAVAACNELVTRHPQSRYRQQLLPYLRELREGLAQVELQLATRTLERGDAQGAADRARYLVDNYPDTEAVLPGLALLARAYDELQRPQAAAAALQLLADHYRARAQQDRGR